MIDAGDTESPEDWLGASVPMRAWYGLMTLRATRSSPVAVQQAPFLATGNLGETPEPLSSILYPTGMREVARKSFGDHFARLTLQVIDEHLASEYEEFETLRAALRDFRDLPLIRQAQVVACLNCITAQSIAIPLLGDMDSSYFQTSDGCHVLYQAARALFRLRPMDLQSRSVLGQVADAPASEPALSASAAIMLASILIRADANIDLAAKVLSSAEGAVRSCTNRHDGFIATLIKSRYSRVCALLSAKADDWTSAAAHLSSADEASIELHKLSQTQSSYRRLVAAENRKIVLEAQLKLASMQCELDAFASATAEILELDIFDPYTWRYVAVYSGKTGLAFASSLAIAGLTAIGGLGVEEAIQAASTGSKDARNRSVETSIGNALTRLRRDVQAEGESEGAGKQ